MASRYDHLDHSTEHMSSMEQYITGICSKPVQTIWGENPRTDGKEIYLPYIPKHANQKLLRMHQSTALHEVGHIEYTDFGLLHRRSNSIKAMLHSIWNAIEDVWMEHEQIKRWNGAEFILRDGFNTAIKHGAIKDGSNPADIIPMFVYFHCYSLRSPHWEELEGLTADFYSKAQTKIGSTVDSIAAICKDVVPILASSRDCFALAEAIFNMLPVEDQNKRPSAGESKDNSKALEGAKQDSLEEFEEAENNRLNQEPQKGQPEAEGESEDSSDQSEEEKHNKGSAKGSGDKGPLKKVRRANLPYHKRPLPNGAKLAHALRPIMLDAERRITKNLKSGRINARHLPRVALDDPRIFRKKRYQTVVQAAVGVLIDLSASMEWDNLIETALSVSAEISAALGQLQVPSGIFGFGDDQGSRLVVAKPMAVSRPDSRVFGLRESVGGGTPLGEALAAIPEQFQTEVRRKILFIVTDGNPNDATLAEKNIQKLYEQGIEPIVINIGGQMTFEPNCMCVFCPEVTELSVALKGELTRALAA